MERVYMAHSGNSKRLCVTRALKIFTRQKEKMGPFHGEAGVICWLAKIFDFIMR